MFTVAHTVLFLENTILDKNVKKNARCMFYFRIPILGKSLLYNGLGKMIIKTEKMWKIFLLTKKEVVKRGLYLNVIRNECEIKNPLNLDA